MIRHQTWLLLLLLLLLLLIDWVKKKKKIFSATKTWTVTIETRHSFRRRFSQRFRRIPSRDAREDKRCCPPPLPTGSTSFSFARLFSLASSGHTKELFLLFLLFILLPETTKASFFFGALQRPCVCVCVCWLYFSSRSSNGHVHWFSRSSWSFLPLGDKVGKWGRSKEVKKKKVKKSNKKNEKRRRPAGRGKNA